MRQASLAALFLALAVPAGYSAAQSNKAVVGTYTLVAANNIDPNTGQTTPMYGPEPRGQLVLTPEGRYSVIMVRPDVPKFSSNLRTKGTPQENAAAVGGGIAHFGSYNVGAGGKLLTFQSEYSTFPNWNNTRLIQAFAIAGDQLKYRVRSASGGGTADITWKRIK
jgi:lipocalin-like protein